MLLFVEFGHWWRILVHLDCFFIKIVLFICVFIFIIAIFVLSRTGYDFGEKIVESKSSDNEAHMLSPMTFNEFSLNLSSEKDEFVFFLLFKAWYSVALLGAHGCQWRAVVWREELRDMPLSSSGHDDDDNDPMSQ